MAMAAHTHTMGVSVSIRRTITPAKYTADTAYKTTVVAWGGGEFDERIHNY